MSCFCGTFKLAVSSDWLFLAVRTSPGKRKQSTLMASTLKVVAYSEVLGQINKTFDMPVMALKKKKQKKKTFFGCQVGTLRWRTSHASHRYQDFILFALVATTRLVIWHGVSTLRIKCCISDICIHKDSTNVVSLSAIVVYRFIAWYYTDGLRNLRPQQRNAHGSHTQYIVSNPTPRCM